jgi:hypothetical protein
MRSTRIKSGVACVLAILLVYSLGCIFDPKPDVEPDTPDPVDWPDLTNKDDVIEYMLLCYEERAKLRYPELLHHDYIWYMQPRDAEELNMPTLNKNQDTDGTIFLFGNAVTLDLEIDPGTWEEIEAVGEEPCQGCWQTDRVYRIQVQFLNDETIYTGHDLVKFIVVPVEDDGRTEYRVRWAYDIDYY